MQILSAIGTKLYGAQVCVGVELGCSQAVKRLELTAPVAQSEGL